MRKLVSSSLAALLLAACSADHRVVCRDLEPGEGFPSPESSGADPNGVALLRCIAGGDRESAVMLIEAGAKADQALAFAVRGRDPRLIRAVVDAAASPDAAEWLAAQPVLANAAEAGDLELVLALLDAGAELDTVPPGSLEVPVRVAARADQIEVMSLLLQRGADPDAPNKEGQTMLWELACRSPPSELRERLLPVLLSASPNLEARAAEETRWSGRTPLSCAAERPEKPLMRALLARGADPNAIVDGGRKILEVVSMHRNADPEVVALLEAAGANKERQLPSSAEVFSALEGAGIEDARSYRMLGSRPEQLVPYAARPLFDQRYADVALLPRVIKDIDGDGALELFLILRRPEGRPEPLLLAALGRSEGRWKALLVREGRLGDPVGAARSSRTCPKACASTCSRRATSATTSSPSATT